MEKIIHSEKNIGKMVPYDTLGVFIVPGNSLTPQNVF